METRLKWRLYETELQILSDDIIDRRETYNAIGKRLELDRARMGRSVVSMHGSLHFSNFYTRSLKAHMLRTS